MLRAAVEDVLGGTPTHATKKANRVWALEMSERVHEKLSRSIGGSQLMTLHGLLGERHAGASEARDVLGLVQRNGRGGSRGRRNESNQDGSSESSGRTVLQFTEHGLAIDRS
jgi:hypothetical protein